MRDVQETGKQLNYGEEAITNMIKSSMPMAMYTSLYDEENLEKIITKVRDIYARPHIKAQIAAEAAASASTAGVPQCNTFQPDDRPIHVPSREWGQQAETLQTLCHTPRKRQG